MADPTLPNLQGFSLPAAPEQILQDQIDAIATDDIPDPLGKDLAFDFFASDFLLNQFGGMQIAAEEQALKQWVLITLTTPLRAYIIYPDNFGCELSSLIGAGLPPSAIVAELPRILKDTLLIHDRIIDIDNINATQVDESLNLNFDIVLDSDAILEFQLTVNRGT